MSNDTEPTSASKAQVISAVCKPSRGSGLGALKRELTPKDLNDSGVQKMLLNLVDSLESENSDLKSTLHTYYITDKALAVLQAKYDGLVKNNTLKGLFCSLGWAIVGFIPFAYEKNFGLGVVIALILVAVGLISIPIVLTCLSLGEKDAKDKDTDKETNDEA